MVKLKVQQTLRIDEPTDKRHYCTQFLANLDNTSRQLNLEVNETKANPRDYDWKFTDAKRQEVKLSLYARSIFKENAHKYYLSHTIEGERIFQEAENRNTKPCMTFKQWKELEVEQIILIDEAYIEEMPASIVKNINN